MNSAKPEPGAIAWEICIPTEPPPKNSPKKMGIVILAEGNIFDLINIHNTGAKILIGAVI